MRAGRLIGNRSRLPFSIVLSLRSQLLHRRMPTVLTVLALTASVGLASSVEMASRSVDSALHQTVESLVGSAQLEVSAGDQGVPEALIEPIRAVPGVLSAAPTIQRTFRVAEGEAADLPRLGQRDLAEALLEPHRVAVHPARRRARCPRRAGRRGCLVSGSGRAASFPRSRRTWVYKNDCWGILVKYLE